MTFIKKTLSIQGQTGMLRDLAKKLPDPRAIAAKCYYPIADFFLTELASFFLNFRSARKFDLDSRRRGAMSENFAHNVGTLFGISHPPSDTRIREVLDEIPSFSTSKILDKMVNEAQKGKLLEKFKVGKDRRILLAIDGFEFFSSKKIQCPSCCTRHHKRRDQYIPEYYHQALVASLIHPKNEHVLFLPPEMIQMQDGREKNDCEINALKRLIPRLRKAHPHLPFVLLLDGLYSNASIVSLCREYNLGFIIVAKQDNHKNLFDYGIKEALTRLDKNPKGDFYGSVHLSELHRLKFYNDVKLNDSSDIRINVLIEEKRHDELSAYKMTWAWITDDYIDCMNANFIRKFGHKRWTEENGAFNRSTNLEGHLKHNFGHGAKYLCHNLFNIQLIAQNLLHILELTDRNWINSANLERDTSSLKNVERSFKDQSSNFFIETLRTILMQNFFTGWNHLLGIDTINNRQIKLIEPREKIAILHQFALRRAQAPPDEDIAA